MLYLELCTPFLFKPSSQKSFNLFCSCYLRAFLFLVCGSSSLISLIFAPPPSSLPNYYGSLFLDGAVDSIYEKKSIFEVFKPHFISKFIFIYFQRQHFTTAIGMKDRIAVAPVISAKFSSTESSKIYQKTNVGHWTKAV